MAPFRKTLSALLVGFSLSPVAWSLGFGELQLQSDLNQPLQAEIPILGVPAYASDSIRIRVGKREDFSALGYDYSPDIDGIRTELVQRDTRLVLQLRSSNALREPLLNLVLVAEEGNTRYLRDYAILLDLPGSRPAAVVVPVVPVASEVAPVPATVSNTNSSASSQTIVTTAKAASPAPSVARAPAPVSTATAYGPTQPGDSLSKIAYRLGKAAGVEWQAYGVALYHANPTAFLAGDPNRLKAAVPLQLPSTDEVARYQRNDWIALFDGSAPIKVANARGSEAPVAAGADASTLRSETSAAASPTSSANISTSATELVTTASLASLQQQNVDLKNELATATARMQALETQLAQLDSRYQDLTAQSAANPATITNAAPAPKEAQATTVASSAQVSTPVVASAKPVSIEVRDRVPVEESEPALAQSGNQVSTPAKASAWSLIAWPLALVLALIIAGAAFWQWRERHNQRRALKPRVRTPHVPKEILPAAEVDEPAVPQMAVASADRRILKIKQVQSALETYLAYQRFDRALELLEQEMHIAGDDLVLRRQLQRLQKEVKSAQTEWQETHKEQMSELFDRATTTHVDKPAARDDGKKTLG